MHPGTKTVALVIVSALLGSSITFLASKNYFKSHSAILPAAKAAVPAADLQNCDYVVRRLNEYQFVKPIQSIEPVCESPAYGPLKDAIEDSIKHYKAGSGLLSASVYVREFDKGKWMEINPGEGYHPGSLMKLSLLLTLLKHEEKHPGFLNDTLSFKSLPKVVMQQTYNSKRIRLGKTYTIHQLLGHMISYSDNMATNLLQAKVDMEEYKTTFRRLGLLVPDLSDWNYSITAKDYSSFFKILFNAGYLSPKNSELAMRLLADCDFNKGMAAGLPKGTEIAHKFGEWGGGNRDAELHESGIIYSNNKTYLLVIMTKGKKVEKLSAVLSSISKMVYDHFNVVKSV